jgi:hypothetical protein
VKDNQMPGAKSLDQIKQIQISIEIYSGFGYYIVMQFNIA